MVAISWADSAVVHIARRLRLGCRLPLESIGPACPRGVRLESSAVVGRRLLAARPYAAGEAVMEEEPLLAVPETDGARGLWCTRCARPLFDGEGSRACPKGTCPCRFCSAACASLGAQQHHVECPLLGLVADHWPELSGTARGVLARALALRALG
mmetsp:Transcript_72572/g.229368  ORF Transcript_72572/g.229368 Transcript_72572/m.229368 type:complete len:155 (+) Transcript_72572:81-545(+)